MALPNRESYESVESKDLITVWSGDTSIRNEKDLELTHNINQD